MLSNLFDAGVPLFDELVKHASETVKKEMIRELGLPLLLDRLVIYEFIHLMNNLQLSFSSPNEFHEHFEPGSFNKFTTDKI